MMKMNVDLIKHMVLMKIAERKGYRNPKRGIPFSIRRDGLTIRGYELIPEGIPETGDIKCPTVIISHGFMADLRSVTHYAEALSGQGYVVFIFDFCGGCVQGTSDGKTTEMSVLTEREDLLSVYEYTLSKPVVDVRRIFLMGCSQGGFVSALAAARLRDKIAGLIMLYPALCIPDDARKGNMQLAQFDPGNIPDEISCGPMLIGRKYPEDVMNMDAYREIEGYKGSVLLLHGTKDSLVNYSYAIKAREVYADRCMFLLIKGANHGFRGPGDADEIVMQYLSIFLAGKSEVLTVLVRLNGLYVRKRGIDNIIELPFMGRAAGSYFKGRIEPGASDVQRRRGLRPVDFCANYKIVGQDYTGEKCFVRVANRLRPDHKGKASQGGEEFHGKYTFHVREKLYWKPVVTTNSKALDFLNGADCSAYLEKHEGGPIVHIFAKVPKETQSQVRAYRQPGK